MKGSVKGSNPNNETMASNEEIIRDLYVVAEKEPRKFRSLFTENGYWWDVPAGVKYQRRRHRCVRFRSTRLHFRTCTAHSTSSTLTVTTVVVQLSTERNPPEVTIPIGLGTIPATGKEFHVPCVDVFRLEDGKVSAFDCYYAGTIMLAQLGVLVKLGGLAQEV